MLACLAPESDFWFDITFFTTVLAKVSWQISNFNKRNVNNEYKLRLQGGVRQGDTRSPKLSIIVCVEKVFHKLCWEIKEFKVNKDYPYLRFADDVIIFASNKEELQEMLQKLDQASLKGRHSMNVKKTKFVYNKFAENIAEPTNVNSNEI